MNFKSFQSKVLELTKQVPKGKVTTYKELARKLNTKAYQAVGQALKHNKNPYHFSQKDMQYAARGRVGGSICQRQKSLVPCHRVINSNGNLGGYNSGLKNKIKLLKQENITIKNNKINLKKYLFKFK